MGEGDQVSDEMRETLSRAGQKKYHGWLQRWMERKIDVAVYMFGRDPKQRTYERDADEETPEEEIRAFEMERSTSRPSAQKDSAEREPMGRFKPERQRRSTHWTGDEYEARRRQLDNERRASDDRRDDIAMGRG